MRSKQVSVVREIHTLRSTWRGLETWQGRNAVTPRNRKGEETGNTNFDLNRRASLRPYQETQEPVLAISRDTRWRIRSPEHSPGADARDAPGSYRCARLQRHKPR